MCAYKRAALEALAAQLGAAEVAARVAEVAAAQAAETARRNASTMPPGADDAAARRWARKPTPQAPAGGDRG